MEMPNCKSEKNCFPERGLVETCGGDKPNRCGKLRIHELVFAKPRTCIVIVSAPEQLRWSGKADEASKQRVKEIREDIIRV